MALLTLMVPFDPDMRTGLGNNSMPPLRLACLAAACRAAGHRVQVVDGVGSGYGRRWTWRGRFHVHGLGFEELLARIPSATDVLGISLMFSQCYPPVRELLYRIRAARPDLFVVLGGEGCTGLADFLLRETPADAVVVGEGEAPLVAILRARQHGAGLDGIPNVVTRNTPEAQAVRLHERGDYAELDRLPQPDWSGIPLEAYWKGRRVHGVAASSRFIPMVASRGCPYRCKFCTAPGTWGGQRYASVDTVIEQLRFYRDRYGVDYFIFNDLSITTDIRWFEAFIDRLLAENLGIRWAIPSGVRAQRLSCSLLRKCRDSGLVYLQISPETGSERVMRWIDKRMDIDSVIQTVVNAKAVGLRVSASLVVGHPVERWDDYLETLDFLALLSRLGVDEVVLNVFTPLPGSPAFRERYPEGATELDDDWFADLFLADIRAPVSHTPHFSGSELRLLRLYAYLWFYGLSFGRRPGALFASLRRAAMDQQEQKLDRILRYELWSVIRGFAPTIAPRSLAMLVRVATRALWHRRRRRTIPAPQETWAALPHGGKG